MPVEVRVPALGESVTEATVAGWRKHEGDTVAAGEALVELETEKVNVEVTAERSGVLQRIDKQIGETVHPGDVLALLGEAAEGAPASGQPVEAAATNGETTASQAGQSGDLEWPHASPLARRIAQEHGVDLAQVAGSGTAGRVTREDVERVINRSGGAPATPATPPDVPTAAAAPAAPAAAQPAADRRGEERIRMSRRRQTIAQRLLEAQRTAAILTTFNEVDLSAVMDLRRRHRDSFREKHSVGLGYMSFFTKAVVAALKTYPRLNAEIQGDEMVLKRYYDIGIAVGAEEGLVVPILRDADRKSFGQIEREIAELAEKARTNKLTLDDLRGGTFTITNGGVFGSLQSTPILSPPQVGILGMHRIEERPVVRNGEIVARPMMYLALSYDHRIVDGREAVLFLVRVRDLLEDPEALLLEG